MRPSSEYANHGPRARRIARMMDAVLAPLLGQPGSPVRRIVSASGPRRVLLIRPDHAGDLLMATPAIRALRRAHPEAWIEILVSPWGAPAVRDNPDIDRVRTIEATWFEPGRRAGPDPARLIGAVLGLRYSSDGGAAEAREVAVRKDREAGNRVENPGGSAASRMPRRSRAYDAAADLRGDFRSILIALASGAPRRAGFSRVGLETLLTDCVPLDPTMDHVSRNHAIAALLGAGPLGARRPVFEIPARAETAAERLLAPLPSGRPIVTIHPGTNRPWASWGAERFAETAAIVAREGGLSIVADGREADRPAAETVLAAAASAGRGAVMTLAGRTDLAEAAAVIRRSAVLLANDSGAAHLAVAVGTPVVAIFGPTDPRIFWTWDRPDTNVALAGPSLCDRPCFRSYCQRDHGYSSIAPAEVAALVRRLLAAKTVGESR